MVECTPGRPLVRPSVRRTPAVKGLPRSRWLTALGIHAQRVVWVQPKTWPSWLTREALAALPESFGRREVRDDLGTPGCRTRQITLVTTLLDAESSRVADLAERYRQRWQVETARAHLKTTRPREVWHGHTVSGVLTALTALASVYTLVRMVLWPSARRPHLGVERISVLEALRWLSAPSTGIP